MLLASGQIFLTQHSSSLPIVIKNMQILFPGSQELIQAFSVLSCYEFLSSIKGSRLISCITIPDRVMNSIQMWNHSSVSIAGRVVLINNTIFSIPYYILSMMNLPDTILCYISKMAHNYLLDRTSNNSAFNLVGWTITTLRKPFGGGGGGWVVKYVQSQPCKAFSYGQNIFAILNFESKIWIDIFNYKFNDWHV